MVENSSWTHVCCPGGLIAKGVWPLLCGAQWGRDHLSHSRRVEVHMEVLRDLHTLVSVKEGKGQKNGSIWGGEKWPSSNLGKLIAQSANSLSTFPTYHLSLFSSVLSIHHLSIHVLIYLSHACIYMHLSILWKNTSFLWEQQAGGFTTCTTFLWQWKEVC